MTITILIISATILLNSITIFALLKSAKIADEAWEKAIKNIQNKDIK